MQEILDTTGTPDASELPISRTGGSQAVAPARSPLYAAIGLQLISLLVTARYVGIGAWDDGAITLAFSKTFAHTGRISLTPLSEQVEGFSSLSWFLINSVVACFNPSFEHAILFSQVLSGAFLSISLCYLFLICNALRLSRRSTYLVLIIVAVSGPSFAEVSNGMEMTLLCASGLAIIYYLYLSPAPLLAIIATVIFLATRFESCVYYPFLVAPLLLHQRRKEAMRLLLVAAAILLLLSLLRYYWFADLLPNTIYAKMNPPYRALRLQAIRTRILAPLEMLEVLAPFVAVVAGLFFLGRKRGVFGKVTWQWRSPATDAMVLAILGAELFAFMTGKNWGYDGRMTFFAMPGALLLLALAYDRMIGLLSAPLRTASLVAVVLTIPLSWAAAAGQQIAAIKHSLQPERYATPTLSPKFFRDTALAVERLRVLLHLQNIVYMTADVGGVGLCCSQIRIVDSGLLTNRILARGGYQQLGTVLAAERPDVIETRWEFAALPGLYRMEQFKSEYEPVLVNRTRLFLRKDHAQALLRDGIGVTRLLTQAQYLQNIEVNHRYHGTLATNSVDDAQYFQYGSYIEIP
jgi:hypothetical protein